MEESVTHDRLERVTKALPLVLAGLYVAGFIIVALRLAGYGASSLDLFRIQYIAAGFWFSITAAIFFTFSASVCPLAKQLVFQTPPKAFGLGWRFQTKELIAAIVGDFAVGVLVTGMIYGFNAIDLH
ncbi:MAG: hypothetical protein WCE61_22130, partial [Candidatus Acidiferrum sp.]